jgi:choline-glycine betaine transporter
MLTFIIFCVVIIFHPVGRIRLGGPNALPKMNRWQWFSIALCTGIGAGVVFWGASEPLIFVMEPAPSFGYQPASNEAIKWGMRTVFLHWTFVPYASSVVFGIVLAYVCHNMKMPYRVSSALVPAFGKEFLQSRWALVVDVVTVFSITGAVAGGLGYGFLQLSQGLRLIFGIDPGVKTCIMSAILLFSIYMASSLTGLKKGINWLSNKNTSLFFLLMVVLLVYGPTAFILNLMTESTGAFIGNFIEAITYTAPYPNGELWPQWWDMYWWVDWLAYGPVLGLFFVRLGYGRTLREFVVVNMIMPSLFGIAWFSVFGGNVIHGQIFQGVDYYSMYLEYGAEAVTLSLLEQLPFAGVWIIVMMIVVTISLATQCDSMVISLSSMSITNGSETLEPPATIKWFWGLMFISVALIFTLTGGIEGVKIIKSFCGMPITIFGLVMVFGFVRYISRRPRNQYGDYVYEEAVAEATDSGEKEIQSKGSILIDRIRKKL